MVPEGAWAVGSRAARVLLDVLLPPRCIGCGEPVGRQGELCAGCWSGLRFFQPPWCRCCGRPLPHAAAGEPLCGACARAEPPFGRARAALAYDDASRSLILAFKHRDRLAGARTFARWMMAAGADVLPDCDVVAPVPLHRWRLLRRGYNQAAILGGLIARSAGLRWCPDLLERRHATASQQGLGAMARARNVTASAFRVARRHGETVRGSRILLVDDVMTTGSTLAACTSVLRRAGADHVYALALARVVLDESRTI